MDKNRLIGSKNGLPWHLPADFKHFKEISWPPEENITDWLMDYYCYTPIGNQVETDGIDHQGWPSWLLIIGMI